MCLHCKIKISNICIKYWLLLPSFFLKFMNPLNIMLSTPYHPTPPSPQFFKKIIIGKSMYRLWSLSKYMYVFHNYNSHTHIRHSYIWGLFQNVRKMNKKLYIGLAIVSLPACHWCCSQTLQVCPLGNQTPLWSLGKPPPQTCHLKCPSSVLGEAWKLPDRRAWNTWSSTGRACHLGSLLHFPPSKHNDIYIIQYCSFI